jgi:hypothetical protein
MEATYHLMNARLSTVSPCNYGATEMLASFSNADPSLETDAEEQV